MKKTVSSILLASALLLGAIAPVTANAATGDNPSTGTTTGTITFTKPATTTTPVDPTDPTTPVTPTDPDNPNGGAKPGDDADLTFLYVSPKMDFGSHVADQTTASSSKTYSPTSIESTVFKVAPATPKLVTEVSDTRGTNAGWNITVGSSDLAAGSDVIKDAHLNLAGDQATIKNSADSNAVGTPANLVTGGDAATIYSAATGVGAGSTAMQLDASNIVLTNIPANVKATEAGTAYTATLNWTLNNTPAK